MINHFFQVLFVMGSLPFAPVQSPMVQKSDSR